MVKSAGKSFVTQRRKLGVGKLDTVRGRTESSKRWLRRQLNDPYVHEAQARGYRSRAAFKLLEIDDKFKLLKPDHYVVDLGAAPGGWTQVAAKKIHSSNKNHKVIGLDIQEMEPIPGATLIQMDFMEEDAEEKLLAMTPGAVDGVLSDMAASACGIANVDHMRIISLVEVAYEFAHKVLKPEGYFVAKVLRGGTEGELLKQLKQSFRKVQHFKPPSSRKDSAEMFVVAQGFKGDNTANRS